MTTFLHLCAYYYIIFTDLYEIVDQSLGDIQRALDPQFAGSQITNLDSEAVLRKDVFGVSYLPGPFSHVMTNRGNSLSRRIAMRSLAPWDRKQLKHSQFPLHVGNVGLNNLKMTDYVNVALQVPSLLLDFVVYIILSPGLQSKYNNCSKTAFHALQRPLLRACVFAGAVSRQASAGLFLVPEQLQHVHVAPCAPLRRVYAKILESAQLQKLRKCTYVVSSISLPFSALSTSKKPHDSWLVMWAQHASVIAHA